MINIISILIGGGILTFLQFLINRHDRKNDKTREILESLNKLNSEVEGIKNEEERHDALTSRIHILRFCDELYDNRKHTKEYFEQTLDDIALYNAYCAAHPEFANGRTKAAAGFIEEEYIRLFKEHKL